MSAASTEVYATLLDRGTYLASIRTMYRVLAEVGEDASAVQPECARYALGTATTETAIWGSAT